ncbi:MAG TPA: hypothetical protein VGP47_06210 [Parachlamydiaceae bacterium]|nr:hypothetical protein [Parachlamydiaceae bacterium]
MKISKYLIIFCVFCCAATSTVRAESDLITEFTNSQNNIEELMSEDSDHSKVLKQLALFVFEKQLKNEIKRKQGRIKRYLEEIEYLEETLVELRDGDIDSWWFGQSDGDDEETLAAKKLKYENSRLQDIEEYFTSIADIEGEIAQYNEFLKKVQAWKNSLS